MSKPGRNDPCSCGSGQKYKKCCLDKNWEEKSKAHYFSRQYSKKDRISAVQKLLRYSEGEAFEEDRMIGGRIYWGDRLDGLNEAQREELGSYEQAGINFQTWLLYDLEIEDGKTITDFFLENEGKRLSRGECAYLDLVRKTTVRLYEVRQVIKGEGFLLEDLWDGKYYDVQERAASHSFEQWDLMAARLINTGEDHWEIEAELYNYSPRDKADLLKLQKKTHKKYLKDTMLDPSDDAFFKRASFFFNHWWFDLTMFPERPEMPKMQTVEGDEWVLTRVVFDLLDHEKLLAALEANPSFQGEDANQYIWQDAAPHEDRVLGRLMLRKKRLVLETHSKERGEQGRDALEQIAGSALRYRLTEYEDIKQSLKKSKPQKTSKQQEGLPPEVTDEMVSALLNKHYEKWLDDKIPALSNRTPRHAVTLKTYRPKVIALLKEMENNQAHGLTLGKTVFDFTRLWEALDLLAER